jgi:hypothetical protein
MKINPSSGGGRGFGLYGKIPVRSIIAKIICGANSVYVIPLEGSAYGNFVIPLRGATRISVSD